MDTGESPIEEAREVSVPFLGHLRHISQWCRMIGRHISAESVFVLSNHTLSFSHPESPWNQNYVQKKIRVHGDTDEWSLCRDLDLVIIPIADTCLSMCMRAWKCACQAKTISVVDSIAGKCPRTCCGVGTTDKDWTGYEIIHILILQIDVALIYLMTFYYTLLGCFWFATVNSTESTLSRAPRTSLRRRKRPWTWC